MRRVELKRKARLLRRATREAACERCGKPFISYHRSHGIWTRYCSRACAGGPPAWVRELGTKASIEARRSPSVEVVCLICGRIFAVGPAQLSKRKTCSRKCAAELKRSRGGKHRLGPANPNFKSGKRTGVRDRAGEERWRAALGDRCMVPGCATPYGGTQPLFLHHICYRQHVRAAGGDIWDPRNGLTVCNSCHVKHHRRSSVIPASIIPAEAIEFAIELLGEARSDAYVDRYYAPR